jgi:hypothetical protein
LAVDKQELAAEIYARLVANYPHIHTKIGPGGKPTAELEHVLNMVCHAAYAAAEKFLEMKPSEETG